MTEGIVSLESLVPIPASEGKMYLKYGVTIYFHAAAGHTLGNYWNIKCVSMSVTKHQDERQTSRPSLGQSTAG